MPNRRDVDETNVLHSMSPEEHRRREYSVPCWSFAMKAPTAPEECKLRPATADDASAIAMLTAELGYPAKPELMRARIGAVTGSGNDLLLVAIDSADQVAGWIQAHASHVLESGFRVAIVGLVVSAKARRCGIGRALVAAVERWAAGLGAKSLVVQSNVTRADSHLFYPALGFITAKTQHVYRKPLS
jgi:GNAT superfamily N-acetyltransferase